MLLSSLFRPRTFWIGYSTLHFSVAACYASYRPTVRHNLILFSKTTRFQRSIYEGFPVYRISSLKFFGLTIYALLTGSEIWSSGISPNTTSRSDLLCFRFLYLFKRLFFYDDGLAGCVSDTYTWVYTKSLFPGAKGSITWNYPALSSEFSDAPVRLPLTMLKSLSHRNLFDFQCKIVRPNKKITLFIESAAINKHLLLDHYLSNAENYDYAFYFPHARKSSVLSQFVLERQSLERYQLLGRKIIVVEDTGSLEAALIQLIESSCTVSLHCGCTSTLLLILAFFKQNSINCKPQVILAPNYEAVIKAKVAQSESFYKIISDLFSSDCTFTILQEPLIKKPRK
jgi:hypothetical protein